MSAQRKDGELSPWISVPLGLLLIGGPVVLMLGITGHLGNTFGAVCIGLLLVLVAVVVIGSVVGFLRRAGRAANTVIDRNDPRSPRYRG